METVLPYAYVNVSVRKHCLSKKITAHVMSAVMRELFDKWEFDELKLTYHNVLFFVFVSYFKSNILVHINCIVCFLNGK